MCYDYYTLDFMDPAIDTTPIAPALAAFFDDVLQVLRCAAPCCAVTCCAVTCCAVLCHALLCTAMCVRWGRGPQR